MRNPPTIVVNKNTPHVVEAFSTIGRVVPLETAAVTPEAVRDADILVVRSETRVDRHLLEGSSVRFVGTVTIGTDHIDRRYLESQNIAFASAPGSNANSVAEYLAAALLSWSRRTKERLEGKTIGIVGVGNVGSRVRRVAEALGMRVLLNDPPLARRTGDRLFLPLDDLMSADFITLHVPMTKEGEFATYHLFDEKRLEHMRRGSALFNTSRGGVVDTSALLFSLRNGHLSASILDVWEREPRIDPGLLREAFIATPHIAGYSLDGKMNALQMVYHAVCEFLGVNGVWKPAANGTMPDIVIDPAVTDPVEILQLAVRTAYDIEQDDRNLRGLSSLGETERGTRFMQLRAGYRVRREFSNYTVRLRSHQLGARGPLEALGFGVHAGSGSS